MTILLLSIMLCWDPAPEPDFWKYEIIVSERFIVQMVPCPRPEAPAAMCPEYNPFMWHTMVKSIPSFFDATCATTLGSVCYFKHPTAFDLAGNQSPATNLTVDTINWSGTCP